MWVRFDDGSEGVTDCVALLGSPPTIRVLWLERGLFGAVRVNAIGGLVWGDGEFDMGPDMVYMRVMNKRLGDNLPQVRYLCDID